MDSGSGCSGGRLAGAAGAGGRNTSFDIRAWRFYSAGMDILHAPWRIEYILAPKPKRDESLFVTIAQSSDDEGNLVIARDRTCFALLNRYPYNGGHLMVVPYKQAPDLDGLTDEEVSDLWKLVRRGMAMLKRVRALPPRLPV